MKYTLWLYCQVKGKARS